MSATNSTADDWMDVPEPSAAPVSVQPQRAAAGADDWQDDWQDVDDSPPDVGGSILSLPPPAPAAPQPAGPPVPGRLRYNEMSTLERAGDQLRSGVEGMRQGFNAQRISPTIASLTQLDNVDSGKPEGPDANGLIEGYATMTPEERARSRSRLERSLGDYVANLVASQGRQSDLARNPRVDAMIQAGNAGRWGEVWALLKDDPFGILQQLSVESAPASLPPIVAGMATAGVGAAPVVVGAAAGLGTIGVEYGPRLVEGFTEAINRRNQEARELAAAQGDPVPPDEVDASNPAAVAEFMRQNPAMVSKAAQAAARGAVGPALADAITGGLAMGIRPGLGVMRNTGRVLGNAGMEVVSEPAGDALGGVLANGEAPGGGDLLASALGVLPQTAGTTATGTIRELREAQTHGTQNATPGAGLPTDSGVTPPAAAGLPSPGGSPLDPAQQAAPPIAPVDPSVAAVQAAIASGQLPPNPTKAQIQVLLGVGYDETQRIQDALEQAARMPIPPAPVEGEEAPVPEAPPEPPAQLPPQPYDESPPPVADTARTELEGLLNDPRPMAVIQEERQQQADQAALDRMFELDEAQQQLPAGWQLVDEDGAVSLLDPNGDWQWQGSNVPTAEELAGFGPMIEQQTAMGVYDDALREGAGTRADPVRAQRPSDIDAAAAQVNTAPTPGQAEANNYQAGHVKVAGLDITIETPRGATRSGVSPDGTAWSVQMPAHYGYVKGTVGKDGDHVDVYLGPQTTAQDARVFIVDQVDPKTGAFDEHKAMVGFATPEEATAAYDAAFSDGSGPRRRGALSGIDLGGFKAWLKDGNQKQPYNREAVRRKKLELSGKAPGRAAAVPRTLTEFITQRGGLRDTGGDVRYQASGQNKFSPRFGMLIRPGGMELDRALEAAREAGYFPQGVDDTNALLEALDREARGLPAFQSEEDAAAEALREGEERERQDMARLDQTVQGLRSWVSDTGAVVTNEELQQAAERALLEGTDPQDELIMLLERELGDAVNEAAAAAEPGSDWDIPWSAENGQAPTPEEARGAGESRPDAGGQPAGPGERPAPPAPAPVVGGGEAGGSPQTEAVNTTDGERQQGLIPGVAPVTTRDRLAVESNRPLRGGDAPPPAGGLFDPGATQQPDMLDQARGQQDIPESASPAATRNEPAPESYPAQSAEVVAEPEPEPVTPSNSASFLGAKIDMAPEVLAERFRDHFADAGRFASIAQARAFAARLLGRAIKPGTPDAKMVDEAVELGVVLRAREIAQSGLPTETVYDDLVELYADQPRLATRTSDSIEAQAYSTPAPLAYLASRLADVGPRTWVLEPSAGNGMLLMETTPDRGIVNELDPDRMRALQAQGFNPWGKDSAEVNFEGRRAGAVLANPPFGVVREDDGSSRSFDMKFIQPGYRTNEIDHAIALRALEGMAKDGRAVLILGGINKTIRDPQKRADAYNGKAKREFYHVLFNHYRVTDMFTVAGELYAKQGAAWPVDVIVIEGRGKSDLRTPNQAPPPVLASWDALKEKLPNGERLAVPAPAPGLDARGDEPRGGGNPADPGRPAGPADGAALPAAPGRPSGVDGGDGAQPRRRNRKPAAGAAEQGSVAVDPAAGDGAGRPGDGAAAGESGVAGLPEPGAGRAGAADDEPATGARPGAAGEADQPGALDGGRVPADGRPDVKATVTDEETEKQVAYKPRSKAQGVGTLVPVNMQSATERALQAAEKRAGKSLDELVADKLGYSVDEAREVFSAEQIDALALGIQNIDAGKGFVIGDQTGIGKGRFVAGMIRYAIRKNLVPVFMTEKDNLYRDMARDLTDIGMADALDRIIPTNAGMRLPLTEDEGGQVLRTPPPGKHNAALQALDPAGKIIFTTYSQAQQIKGADTARIDFLRRIMPKAFLILDESHNAGGTVGEQAEGKADRGAIIRGFLDAAASAAFSSATWAKRPDVMDLYGRKTDMRDAVEDIGLLAEAISSGGVPMQQITSAMLAESGQYIRRERSFAGVEYDIDPVEVDRDTYDGVAGILSSIYDVSRAVSEVAKEADKEARAEAKAVTPTGSTGGAGVESVNFGAVMHNLINQLLLSSTADGAVNRALKALESGEKPVITVANTMGSFIQEFAEDNGLKPGDEMKLDFGGLLRRYLDKTMVLTEKRPFMEKGEKATKIQVTPDQLSPEGQTAYRRAIARINELDLSSLPISPLDYIIGKMQASGYKVGEITGRTEAAEYRNGKVYYRRRPDSEIKAAGKLKAIAGFNSGDIDLMLLNQSGATGLSLHASSKFKDQRRRRMIIAQAEANIDTHMQMLGRVHRTGQVVTPAYNQLMPNIPASKRPAAVLAKKMASLSAATTANRSGSLSSGDAVDFLNVYGDQVVAEMLDNDPDLAHALGIEETRKEGSILPDLARKASGRIPLLPLERQEAVYAQIERQYARVIQQADEQGNNVLEAKTLDLDAKEIGSQGWTKGKGGGLFGGDSQMTQFDVKKQSRPASAADIAGRVYDAIGAEPDEGMAQATPSQIGGMVKGLAAEGAAYQRQLRARVESALDSARKAVANNPKLDIDKRTKANQELTDKARHLQAVIDVAQPGALVEVRDGTFPYTALVVGLAADDDATGRKLLAASAWDVRLIAQDGTTQTLALSQVLSSAEPAPVAKEGDDGPTVLAPDSSAHGAFFDSLAEASKSRRETRWMATGNLLAAYAHRKGQIVNFTDSKGNLRQGILMPQDFDPAAVEKAARKFTAEEAAQLLQDRAVPMPVVSIGPITVARTDGGDFTVLAPQAKSVAGPYYLDRALRDLTVKGFTSAAGRMRGSVYSWSINRFMTRVGEVAKAQGDSITSKTPEAADWKPQLMQGWGAIEESGLTPDAYAAARAVLDRMTGRRVEMEQGPTPAGVDGAHLGGLVRLALSISDDRAGWVVRHEGIHAIKSLGLLTAGEWQALERESSAEWLAQFDIRSRYRQHKEMSEASILEEGIAEAFALWATGQHQPRPVIERIFAKILELLERLRNGLAGRGFVSIDGIFRDIEGGQVGQRVARYRRRDDAAERMAEAFGDPQSLQQADVRELMGEDFKFSQGTTPALRQHAQTSRQSFLSGVARIWRGAPVPADTTVEGGSRVQEGPLGGVSMILPPEVLVRKFPPLAALVQQGIAAEQNMSKWSVRLNKELDGIQRQLKAGKGDWAKVSETLLAADADQVDLNDAQTAKDFYQEQGLSPAEATAAAGVRALLEKQARLVDQHRRAMLPQVRARKTQLFNRMIRLMATARIPSEEYGKKYRRRAHLNTLIKGGQGDLAAHAREVEKLNRELRVIRSSDPKLQDQIAELQEEYDTLEARLNSVSVRTRKGYFPHKFFGSWRLAVQDGDDENGKPAWREITSDQGFYDSRDQALAAAGAYKAAHPEAVLRVSPKMTTFPAGGTQLTDAAYFRLRDQLEERAGLTGTALNDALDGVAQRRNRRRVFAPGRFRTGMEGFSKDSDQVLRTHIAQSVRYVEMDKLKSRFVNTMESEGLGIGRRVAAEQEGRGELQRMMEAWFRDVNGSKQATERVLDNMLQKLGVPKATTAATLIGAAVGKTMGLPFVPIMAGYVGYRVYDAVKKGGDFPLRTLIGNIQSDMAHLKLGMVVNLGSATANLTQTLINTWPVLGEKYTAIGIQKATAALWSQRVNRDNPGRMSTDAILLQRADIQSRYVLDAASPLLAGQGSKMVAKVKEISMWAFTGTEQVNRAIAFLGAYHRAQDGGASPAESMRQAVAVLNRTQFHQGNANRPELLRNQLLRLPTQFKGFLINQLRFMAGLENKGQVARFALGLFLAAGFLGLAGLQLFDWLLQGLFGWSPVTELKNLAILAGASGSTAGTAADVFMRGLPSMLGADISARVGMGAGFLPDSGSGFAGPAASTAMGLGEVFQKGGRLTDYLRTLSPGVGAPLQALEAAANGASITSSRFWTGGVFGDGVSNATNFRQKGMTEWRPNNRQLMLNAAGFRTTEQALLADQREVQLQRTGSNSKDASAYLAEIIQARLDGRDEIGQIAAAARRNGVTLTPEQIRNAVRQAGLDRATRDLRRAPRAQRQGVLERQRAIETREAP